VWKIVQLFFLRDRPGVKQREIPGVAKNTVEILSYAREKATRRTGQLARKHVKENLLVCETCLPKLPQSFTVNIVVLYLSWHCLGLALIKTIQWCMVINNSCKTFNFITKLSYWISLIYIDTSIALLFVLSGKFIAKDVKVNMTELPPPPVFMQYFKPPWKLWRIFYSSFRYRTFCMRTCTNLYNLYKR
jgi:hypothetical protein